MLAGQIQDGRLLIAAQVLQRDDICASILPDPGGGCQFCGFSERKFQPELDLPRIQPCAADHSECRSAHRRAGLAEDRMVRQVEELPSGTPDWSAR
jgi:hypothetical protein